MTGDLAAAAIEYARSGVPVFPVDGKIPLTKNGFKDATADVALVTEWWGKVPAAGIGIPTGLDETFDVLDCDGDDGYRSLAALVDEHGPLGAGAVALTGSGGAHYFFAPSGLGNRAGMRPGLDWRGAGGFVVVAPSPHVSGNRYEWVTPPTTPLPVPPEWVLELVRKPQAQRAPERSAVAAGDVSAYVSAAIRSEVERVATAPEGQRNHTLNRAAFSLGQLVGANLVDASIVVAHLIEAAASCGLVGFEVERTIASGLKCGIAQPRAVA